LNGGDLPDCEAIGHQAEVFPPDLGEGPGGLVELPDNYNNYNNCYTMD